MSHYSIPYQALISPDGRWKVLPIQEETWDDATEDESVSNYKFIFAPSDLTEAAQTLYENRRSIFLREDAINEWAWSPDSAYFACIGGSQFGHDGDYFEGCVIETKTGTVIDLQETIKDFRVAENTLSLTNNEVVFTVNTTVYEYGREPVKKTFSLKKLFELAKAQQKARAEKKEERP